MPDPGDARISPFLGGRLRLLQRPGGHRAGTDAVLLAAAAPVEAGDSVVDVGSGIGTVGLAMALREPACRVTLLEREPAYAALARDNVALNGLSDRVVVLERDLSDAEPSTASLLVSNPPFHSPGATRPSTDPLKARAHALDGLSHGGWLIAALRLARPHARIVMIHRPDALPALLDAASGRCGGLRLCPVFAKAGAPAIRILLAGIVGSRAPLSIGPTLILHEVAGGFTPQAAALHRGEATLDLFSSPSRKSRPRGPAS